MAFRRRLSGDATSFAAAPAMVVTVTVAAVATPLTDALSVAGPASVPSTTTVLATPLTSVVALVGVSPIPPPPLAEKLTAAPLTAWPFASDTFTLNVPIVPFTAPVVVGDVLTSTRAGGPI